ncbi:TMEM14 family protein [Leptolyngbya sp. AN10]|uniref:TMEM14 family protein n=1 Tax=Leptolyngbya sp. AN10 TaxID=3423365 RepID=UPI003D31EFC4
MIWTVLIAVYGALIAIGGIIGYTKARSRDSLLVGLSSGVALLFAAYVTSTTLGNRIGALLFAALIAITLAIFFSFRWRVTRKFMPAGLMMILSTVATIAFAAGFVINWVSALDPRSY